MSFSLSAHLRLIPLLSLAGVAPASAAVDFEKQVLPIIDAKCMDCHKAPYEDNGRLKKPKAELRLDAAWAILHGSENGKVLKPGDSKGSYLYEVTTLPEDDDMFMPPKGDPLTAEEKKLLKEWIDEGAKFGGWKGNLEGKPADAEDSPEAQREREHEVFYTKLAEGVEPASKEALAKVQEAGAQVSQLKPDSPLLRVDFLTGVSACTDEKVAALMPIAGQIAQLDLARTAITDATAATLAKFPHLARLDLRQTAVGDKTLEQLKDLKNLRTLNLFDTEVTDAGIKNLEKTTSLREIYLYNTKVTAEGAKKLAASNAKLIVSHK